MFDKKSEPQVQDCYNNITAVSRTHAMTTMSTLRNYYELLSCNGKLHPGIKTDHSWAEQSTARTAEWMSPGYVAIDLDCWGISCDALKFFLFSSYLYSCLCAFSFDCQDQNLFRMYFLFYFCSLYLVSSIASFCPCFPTTVIPPICFTVSL